MNQGLSEVVLLIIVRMQKITIHKIHLTRMIQKVFEGFESVMGDSSSPRDVAETILNAVNTSTPNIRYPVGKDAVYASKVRAELSDKEMENWARESYMEKKGFIRE